MIFAGSNAAKQRRVLPPFRDSSRCVCRCVSKPDAISRAAQRVKVILSDDLTESDKMNELLLRETPSARLLLALSSGTLMSLAAYALCWLSSVDPWGASTWDLNTLQAGVVGCAAALPFVALQEAIWSQTVGNRLPLLRCIRESYVASFAPLVTNTSDFQVAVMLAADAVPRVLLLLPAAVGSAQHIVQLMQDPVVTSVHLAVANTSTRVAALVFVACAHGCIRMYDYHVTSEENRFKVVNAIKQADRQYAYEATHQQPAWAADEAAAGLPPGSTESAAFKAVACTWLASRNLATRTIATLSTAEVLLFGFLWINTGHLSAAVTAALSIHAVAFVRARQVDRDELPKMSGVSLPNWIDME